MKKITAQETAQKWNVSLRRVQDYCKKGKIPGAERFGNCWMIPGDAVRPVDGRVKVMNNGTQYFDIDMPMPKKTPFLHMTDLYNKPGCADDSIKALEDNPEAQTLLAAELAYSRGDIDKVYETAKYLLDKHSGFYAILSSGMLLALCSIWRGDLNMWEKAKVHIAEAPAKTDSERDIVSFSLTAVDSMLYNVNSFPEWFKIGCFELLHRDSIPAANVFYAKYLYATGYAVATKQLDVNGLHGLSLFSVLPFTIEPMISHAVADRTIIAEAYLRLTCAAVYRNCGNDEQAIRHIDRAIALALPDKFYGLLAEYCRTLDSLLEQRLVRVDPNAWLIVKGLYSIYNDGWSKLSGSVRGRNLYTMFTQKEREVAKLAAFGFKNGEIAEKLHMSISGVKQTITNISNKTGLRREMFATIL